ncbi:MAG: RNA polymerase sigma factor, partial [Chloroflexi bacterium]|nr:RNA polymerase sigma factor [Chloroflexota bacterium]
MHEHELITRIKQGDKDAFSELYDQHVRLVYRYIMARVGNAQEAEDLTADTFAKAWQHMPKYEVRETPIAAWLLRIAHNRVVDTHRKPQPILFPLQWTHAQEETRFSTVDNRDVIQRAFNALSYDEQVMLYLHYLDERTIKEIAELLGRTPNAVQVAEFRALRRLRKALN